MQKKDCFLVGTIFKLHGYKGDVKIYNEDDIPFNFSTIDYFLIELNNELVPFFKEKARSTKPHNILVKFEDINNEEEAKKILKRKVYLQKSFLPKANKEKASKKQLIGYLVVDTILGKLGTITYINSKTTQELIYVKKYGREFCFPWHNKFVKKIDAKKRELTVTIPEKLVNLNL